jgi:hypothetical protein
MEVAMATIPGWSRLCCVAGFVECAFGACSVGEGDACNPDLSHDECNAGLVCTTPANCANAYCCPASGMSTNGNCAACPTDAGVDAAPAADSATADAHPDTSVADGSAPVETGHDASDASEQ